MVSFSAKLLVDIYELEWCVLVIGNRLPLKHDDETIIRTPSWATNNIST
jgi:hypothetical protein